MRRGGLLIAALAGMLTSHPAASGSFSFCKEPFAYNSAVNVYALADVLQDGSEFDSLTSAGERLALLVKLDALFNDSFGSLGVHFLHQRFADPPCTLDELADKVANELPDSGSAVLITHHLFEEQGQILLQTYLEFQGPTLRDPLRLELQNGDFVFEGALPTQAVAFAPRSVSRTDLEAIADLFQAASGIYDAPDASSRSGELPLAPEESVPVWVVMAQPDGWLKVSSTAGLEGWLRADPDGSRRLRALLPELELLEALVGYLSLDAHGRWDVLPKDQIAARVVQRLEGFLTPSERSAPRALTTALLADLTLFRSLTQRAPPEFVLELLVEAVRARPEDAELRNLLALARLAQCCQGHPPAEPEVRLARITQIGAAREDIGAAIQLAPGAQHVLSNLRELLALYSSEGADLEGLRAQLLAGSAETPTSSQDRTRRVLSALEFASARLPADQQQLDREVEIAAALSGGGQSSRHIASVVPTVLYFPIDSAELSPEAEAELEKVIAQIRGIELRRIRIMGHADRTGSSEYNMQLAQKRAEAVASELINAGIPAKIVTTEAFGENQLAVPNDPSAPLESNRRVVIDVTR